MKKFNFLHSAVFAAAILCGSTLVSCGGSDECISKSDVEEAIEDSPTMRDSTNYRILNTGYYEISKDEYDVLQKYINAKLITAKFEVKIENKKHYTSYWYSEYTIKKVKHMFAKVDLTEEGQEYVITEEPKRYNKSYEDIFEKLNEEDKETPEYLTITPAAEDYYINAMKEESDKSNESSMKSNSSDVSAKAYEESDLQEAADEYHKALAASNKIENKMLTCNLKIDEVYDIVCTPEMEEKGEAVARVVMTYKDKTPVFYISQACKSKYFSLTVKLKKFVDKGWVVEKFLECNN